MARITLEEAQKNLTRYFALVADGKETVMITDGKGNRVLLVRSEDSDEMAAVEDFMKRKDEAYRRLAQ